MINALIIEDEVNNREYLRQMLDRFADIAVMGEAGTAEEGIRLIRGVKPDLVFMDIEMPGASGFECLERVRDLNFEIIFVTAYDHYALNAIKFSALDYLLKPVNAAELETAIEKAKRKIGDKTENLRLKNLLESQTGQFPRQLALSSAERIEFISVEDIVRCRGENNYTRFHLAGGREILVSQTLGGYEQILAEHHFLRVHQSHLVNTRQIQTFVKGDGGYLKMTDGSNIPLANSKKVQLMEQLLGRRK